MLVALLVGSHCAQSADEGRAVQRKDVSAQHQVWREVHTALPLTRAKPHARITSTASMHVSRSPCFQRSSRGLGRAPRFAARPSLAVGASSAKATIAQLPIFPLNVVALPCATVPLMIFEARWGQGG